MVSSVGFHTQLTVTMWTDKRHQLAAERLQDEQRSGHKFGTWKTNNLAVNEGISTMKEIA